MDVRSENSFRFDFRRPHEHDQFPNEKDEKDQFDDIADRVDRSKRCWAV